MATGINNAGQIVGYGRDRDGGVHALLLTPVPVPEPGPLAVLGLAGAALGARRLYRRARRGRIARPAP